MEEPEKYMTPLAAFDYWNEMTTIYKNVFILKHIHLPRSAFFVRHCLTKQTQEEDEKDIFMTFLLLHRSLWLLIFQMC